MADNSRSGVTPSCTAEAPFYAFLILYYYQWYVLHHECIISRLILTLWDSLILVHRTALTTREESYRAEVAQRYQIGSRQYKQLLSSQSCCYNSALEMIKIFHAHEEYGISHRLIPISQISYAAVVLSVWILRHPFSSFHAVNIVVSTIPLTCDSTDIDSAWTLIELGCGMQVCSKALSEDRSRCSIYKWYEIAQCTS